MKEKLLLMMFVVAFLHIGTFASEAQASIRIVKDTEFDNVKIGKPMSRSKLVNKFNKSFFRLKEICSVGSFDRPSCAEMIEASAKAFDAMIRACDYNEMSSECANAQTYIEIVAEDTQYYCSFPEQANVIEKKSIPFFNEKQLTVIVSAGK